MPILAKDEALSWRLCKQAFGAQKTSKHTLKSRSTQNESLFGANFGIIGSFFFGNKQGETVAVNGDRYRVMLKEFLFTKII